MTRMESIGDPRRLPLAVYSLFFDNVPFAWRGRIVNLMTVSLRKGGTLKKAMVGDFTYLQQNPHSSSRYAEMVQRGHKVLWIIHTQSGKYVGRVVDGEVVQL